MFSQQKKRSEYGVIDCKIDFKADAAKNVSHISKDVLVKIVHPYLKPSESAKLQSVSKFFHQHSALWNSEQTTLVLTKKIELLSKDFNAILIDEAKKLGIEIESKSENQAPIAELVKTITIIRNSKEYHSACTSRMMKNDNNSVIPLLGMFGGLGAGIAFGQFFPAMTGCVGSCDCCFGWLFGCVGMVCLGPIIALACKATSDAVPSINAVRLSYQMQTKLTAADNFLTYPYKLTPHGVDEKSSLQKFEKEVNALLVVVAQQKKAIRCQSPSMSRI